MSIQLIKEVMPFAGGFIIGKYAVKTGVYFLKPDLKEETKNRLEIIGGLIGTIFALGQNIHEGKIKMSHFNLHIDKLIFEKNFDQISNVTEKFVAVEEIFDKVIAFSKLFTKVNIYFLTTNNLLLNLAGGAAVGKYLTKSGINIYNRVAGKFFGEVYQINKEFQQSMEKLSTVVGLLGYGYQAFESTKNFTELLIDCGDLLVETLKVGEVAFNSLTKPE